MEVNNSFQPMLIQLQLPLQPTIIAYSKFKLVNNKSTVLFSVQNQRLLQEPPFLIIVALVVQWLV